MNFVKKHLFPSQIHNLAEWRWIVVFLEKLDINLFACPYCLTYFLAQSKDRIFWKFEFLFHEDTGVWNQDTMGFRCACTFRHLIIVKKLTNVLLTFTCSILVNYILNLSWQKFQFCNFKLVIRQWGEKMYSPVPYCFTCFMISFLIAGDIGTLFPPTRTWVHLSNKPSGAPYKQQKTGH